MANLYEIQQSLTDTIEYGCDLETGEILSDEELKQKIDEIEMEQFDKIQNVGKYIKNLESDVESFKIEQKKLLDRRKTTENKLNGLRRYLDNFIKLQCTNEDGVLDTKKLKKLSKDISTPSCGISYRNSSSVDITDLSKVPSEFIKEHEVGLDDVKKAEIKKYINEHKDENIDYAKIVENINMQIK